MDLMAATADSLRVRLTEDAAELASADRVLVVLSSGALGCSIRIRCSASSTAARFTKQHDVYYMIFKKNVRTQYMSKWVTN